MSSSIDGLDAVEGPAERGVVNISGGVCNDVVALSGWWVTVILVSTSNAESPPVRTCIYIE